ncbi:MAG: S-adenosyl methyltransferase [Amycolatopsis sp.]|jgi:O-methyltransferase involved in polyketide biosynthesis|uniref:SAM-dependent methyltransferase n=1 Tax=Amycolatopsis sp. TaxID=37632 RepID=UPI0026257F42|nr:SAM-dependent methyltransferase [Amycolatopsis sp.]MCU1679429.1 S-adenosyl methyltransferase [Amycolatopsis sp.]
MHDDVDDRLRAVTGMSSLEKPSSARVYDYFLGGDHNYAIDREFAEQQVLRVPEIGLGMRSNRAFIGRAVRYALDAGIRQFVDIGSGLPSQGQAHEIADRERPELSAHVVYVDNEQIAHAHSEILLDQSADPERHTAVFGDYFEFEDLWPEILDTGLIDIDEPVCLLVTAILHFMPPETRPERAMAFYREQVAPGSALVLSHGSVEPENVRAQQVAANYAKTTNPAYLRRPEEFEVFFGDWRLVDPGVVWTVEWNQDGAEEQWWEDKPSRAGYVAGVALKSEHQP